MVKIWETRVEPDWQPVDWPSEAAAKRFVESHRSGRLVLFVRSFDGHDQAGAMWVWDNGCWRG